MPLRMIPEWEKPSAILLALPHKNSDWNYILQEAQDQCRRIVEALLSRGEEVLLLVKDTEDATVIFKREDLEKISLLEITTNDTWTRDYGPISVANEGDLKEQTLLLDFGFNGWGLKFAADSDNLVNLEMSEMGLFADGSYQNLRSFILEGGSVETDGKGSLLTTTRCLLSPNRNGSLSKRHIEDYLSLWLGTPNILWLDHGYLPGDDTDSHIDTLCRFAPDDTILYTGTSDKNNPLYGELEEMRGQLSTFRNTSGHHFNLIELPLPDQILDEDGKPLPATYANYLTTSKAVYMPVYGQPLNDERACMTLAAVFPDKEIVPLDCRTLILQHGSLHCSTMQIPLDAMR